MCLRVKQIIHLLPTVFFPQGPVLFNRNPDGLCSSMALWVPNPLAVLPDGLHGHSDHTLLKLLYRGEQMLKSLTNHK